MDRLETQRLADILASTSTSRLAGLLAADPTYKADAAYLVARDIARRLNGPAIDQNQLTLPL